MIYLDLRFKYMHKVLDNPIYYNMLDASIIGPTVNLQTCKNHKTYCKL